MDKVKQKLKERIKDVAPDLVLKVLKRIRIENITKADIKSTPANIIKIDTKATLEDIVKTDINQTTSNHQLICAINNMNLNVYKHTFNEVEYAIEMLSLSLKAECYDRAYSLANYLLNYWNDLNLKQKEIVFNNVIPVYFAFGKKEELKELIYTKATEIPTNDKIISCMEVLFSNNEFRRLEENALLPSGRLHIVKFCNTVKYNQISELELIHYINKYATKFTKEPQLYGALWNYFLHNKKQYALYYINKFLTFYSMPKLLEYNIDSNILNRVEFETKDEVASGPLVSIIIAAYNAETNMEYVLRSLANQTYRNIEIIICDDRSEDSTINVLKELKKKYSSRKIKLYQSKQNQGPYNIRNSLIEIAEGDLVTFQDSDDFSLPTRIEIQVKALVESDAIACIGKWIRIRPNGEIVYFQDQNSLRMSVVSLMAPKNIFLENGKYQTVKFGADTHLYEKLRAKYGDKKIINLNKPLQLGLWSENSLTRTKGIEALEDGFRGEARRNYAKLAFEKRYYGTELYNNEIVHEKLKEISVFRENHGISPII